ncbi:MAG: type II toxin-antitoxin system HipA family toxin [Pseudolysinimonas sp.]|uniref:type II toxin-antitoxin system HipA family toxin n=1 Tax=Pseudolysinimonas sp. TaxID=2680009 RepID=UPI003C763472
MATPIERVSVHVQLPSGDEVLVGEATNLTAPGFQRRALGFEYDLGYLTNAAAYELSPDLPMQRGVTTTMMNRTTLGAFADAMPDSWGRRIIQAAHRSDGSRSRTPLDDFGLLIGANDLTRLGALRFTELGSSAYLSQPADAVAGEIELPDLLAAAERFAESREDEDDLRRLLAAGTSAGGARPKATIRRNDGRLALAKFPHPEDRGDVEAWEATCLHLARHVGIATPKFEHVRLTEGRSMLLLERFDRTADGRRIGYLSAESLVLRAANEVVDYATLADHLARRSAAPSADLEDLFRRVTLSLLVNNVDDHMKNHGVLRQSGGWRLSPVFDVNPQRVTGAIEATPISPGADPVDRDIRDLVASAGAFGLSQTRAARIVADVEVGTRDWGRIAVEQFGVHPDAVPSMARAFDGPNRTAANEVASELL